MKKEILVVSLGGSLIVPSGIDWKFLNKFRKITLEQVKKGKRFVIITGGGQTSRHYQQSAQKIAKLTKDDSDWLGIHATRLNAQLIRTIFRNYSHPKINKNPEEKGNLKRYFSKGEGIMIASGWKPGRSTDYVATVLAKRLNSKTVINLTNIKHVYEKDPKKYKNSKKIYKISWKDFRNLVGNKWDPGLNAPFDPVASKNAQKIGLKVVIVSGKDTNNLQKVFNNGSFVGTTIEN